MKDKLKNILTKNKDNKFYVVLKIILSLIFAITIVLDKLLLFNGDVYSGFTEVYFEKIKFFHILMIIGLWLISYVAITTTEWISDKIENTIYSKKEKKIKSFKIFFIALFVIVLCWLPYILSYFPGGIYADTTTSINEATGKTKLTNHNPVIYTLIIRLFIKIGTIINSTNPIQVGIKLFTIFQVCVMAMTCAYFVYWLHKKKISTKYLVLTTMFFSLFNLIPLYAISIWKDTPFCIVLFLFSIFLADIAYTDGKNLEKIAGILKYVILILAVAFFRNNGIYIAIATTIILFIIYRKRILNVLKNFAIASIVELIICIIIQGPVYNHLEMNTEFVENLGVLLQQMCYVVSDDGNITQEQLEYINNVCPIEKIKTSYSPCLADTIKWSGEFNNKYLSENKGQFIKIWFEIFLKNPGSYVKAYLLNTIGYWDITEATFDGYINPEMWGGTGESMGVVQNDYIQLNTQKSLRKVLKPEKAISAALFLFIVLLGFLMTTYKKNYKNLIAYLPALLTWGTIMIAVPLAFSLRYVYILVLMLPMSLILPFIKSDERKD